MNKNVMVQWMLDRKGKITYSMVNRLGPNSYDCSSAVYNALIAGGILPKGTGIGNTETLYALEGKILRPITRSAVKRGDLFISGVKGNSLGSGGHTGIFLSNSRIIHCTYGYGSNNMADTPAYQWMGDYSGLPVHYYEIVSAGGIIVDNKPQQNKLAEDGSFGPATAKRLQEYLGCPIRDGIISHQWRSVHNQYIYAAQFDYTQIGSNVVAALQRKLGITPDGLFGPNTIRALQRYLGTTQDGIISPQSDMVRELQRRLNNNTF